MKKKIEDKTISLKLILSQETLSIKEIVFPDQKSNLHITDVDTALVKIKIILKVS